MTDLRSLCQTLLEESPDPGCLQPAEDFLRSALAAAVADEDARRGFLVPWQVPDPKPPEDPATRRVFLAALAPALLLDGIWLARVAQPATAHRPSENLLFELCCRTLGLDDPARSPPLRFRAHLTTAGMHLPPVDDPGFFHGPKIPDCALVLPCLHLALRHRSRAFFPELLGYTLAHVYRKQAWWDALPGEGAGLESEAGHLALAALEAYPENDAQAERILAGWALYRSAFETLLRAAGEQASRRPTAEDAMAAIVRAKRAYAVGYHPRVVVAGRGLDQWLAEAEVDCRPLLRAIRESPEVDRACPAASRLVRAVDFGGPMFGVFEEAERRVLLEWIREPQGPAAWPAGAASAPAGIAPRARNRRTEPPPATLPRRKLFTALLEAQSPADCPPAADAFVQAMLRRTRRLRLLQAPHRRGCAYSPEAFRGYVESVHRREVDRYRPLSGTPRIGREFCRWAALQLAPAILVDGAWLAGIATAAEDLGEVGRPLLKIYADELGNGHPERNHPNVYRRLLESLNLNLPPVDSAAFANNPEFLDAAFDIPVYLLAMGLRTARYFPELLGLNLAIEISGLGAGYMRTVDILRHHGIDPAIIQLHLSIDNLASGHAALAREAIVRYLAAVGRRQGGDAVEGQWGRIWTGYLSLNIAALGLAARFILEYFGSRLGRRRAL